MIWSGPCRAVGASVRLCGIALLAVLFWDSGFAFRSIVLVVCLADRFFQAPQSARLGRERAGAPGGCILTTRILDDDRPPLLRAVFIAFAVHIVQRCHMLIRRIEPVALRLSNPPAFRPPRRHAPPDPHLLPCRLDRELLKPAVRRNAAIDSSRSGFPHGACALIAAAAIHSDTGSFEASFTISPRPGEESARLPCCDGMCRRAPGMAQCSRYRASSTNTYRRRLARARRAPPASKPSTRCIRARDPPNRIAARVRRGGIFPPARRAGSAACRRVPQRWDTWSSRWIAARGPLISSPRGGIHDRRRVVASAITPAIRTRPRSARLSTISISVSSPTSGMPGACRRTGAVYTARRIRASRPYVERASATPEPSRLLACQYWRSCRRLVIAHDPGRSARNAAEFLIRPSTARHAISRRLQMHSPERIDRAGGSPARSVTVRASMSPLPPDPPASSLSRSSLTTSSAHGTGISRSYALLYKIVA